MSDRTLLVAVGLVGACLLGGLIGIVVLAVLALSIPDVLQNVTIGSLTALVGLLVQTRSRETP